MLADDKKGGVLVFISQAATFRSKARPVRLPLFDYIAKPKENSYMRSKFGLLVVLAFVIVVLASGGLNKAVCAPRDQVRSLLVTIAEEAIRAQGQAKTTDDIGIALSGPHSDSYRDLLLAKSKTDSRPADNPYTEYSATFVVKDVDLDRGGASVRMLEHGALALANPENDPGVPEAEVYEYEHELRFVFEKGVWKLIDDKIVNLPRSAAPDSSLKGIPLPPSTSPLFFRGSSSSPELKSYSFNLASVAYYAQAYVFNYNPYYRSFPGEDCTNFVSQAVRAGGWPDVTGQSVATSNWWYNAFTQSSTWVGAHNWMLFTYNRPRASMAAFVSDLRVGDILQADWMSDGTIDHSMVVTSKSGSEIYLTYHSNDTAGKSFSSIWAQNPNATWYGYLLSSSGN